MASYDERLQPDVFAAGRAASAHTLRVWMQAALRHAAGAGTLIDVGCGTGRFSGPLAGALTARVVALDESARMLAGAAAHQSVSFVRGRAEALPVRDAWAEAAWMSGVIHHVADRDASARELARTVRPGGSLMLRQSFGGRLDGSAFLAYFPTAYANAERTLPSVEDTCAVFGRAGFEFVTLEEVVQETSPTPLAFADRIAMRAISVLEDLPDDEFAQGMASLREHAAASPPKPVTEVVDLLVLRRG